MNSGIVGAGDETGGYCEDCAVAPVIDDPTQAPGVMRYALNGEAAQRLWTRSEELVGEEFNP